MVKWRDMLHFSAAPARVRVRCGGNGRGYQAGDPEVTVT